VDNETGETRVNPNPRSIYIYIRPFLYTYTYAHKHTYIWLRVSPVTSLLGSLRVYLAGLTRGEWSDHRRLIYKEHTSTDAQGTDPRVALGALTSACVPAGQRGLRQQ